MIAKLFFRALCGRDVGEVPVCITPAGFTLSCSAAGGTESFSFSAVVADDDIAYTASDLGDVFDGWAAGAFWSVVVASVLCSCPIFTRASFFFPRWVQLAARGCSARG